MRADNRTCRFGPESAYVDLAAEVFRLLSDPTRIRIILALRDAGELSVNHLAAIIDKSPTSTSQHLAKLRWGRIVGVRQDGTRMFYYLTDEHARELVAQAVFQAEHALGLPPAHRHAAQDAPGPGAGAAACPATATADSPAAPPATTPAAEATKDPA